MTDTPPPTQDKRTLFEVLRNYFVTGLIVAAPISVTIYLVIWVVQTLDGWFAFLIPQHFRPEYYLPFDIPGTGVVIMLVALTLVGWLTANFIGRALLRFSDRALRRTPVAGTVYTALKEILDTALKQGDSSFSQVALIEYPRPGVHAVAFVTKQADPRINEAADADLIGVFLPTTPNPTSGFLLFLPRDELTILDMSVEEGIRFVISAGLSEDKVEDKTEED